MPELTISFRDPPRSPINPHPPWGISFAPDREPPGQTDLRQLWRTFAANYGFVMLMGQGLHFGLIDLLRWYHLRRRLDRLPFAPDVQIDSLSFENSIHEAAKLLNLEHQPTRDFVSRLHQSRKIRNRLSHRVYDSNTIDYFGSIGGLHQRIDELHRAADAICSASSIVCSVAEAYKSDCGLSSELVALISKIDNFNIGLFTQVLLELDQEGRLRLCRDLLAAQERSLNVDLEDLL